MTSNLKRRFKKSLAALLGLALCGPPLSSQQKSDYTFRVESELVLVNATVKDNSGNLIPNLKQQDFTILEDNKIQKIVSFDIEKMDAVATQDVSQAKLLPDSAPAPSSAASTGTDSINSPNQFKDRRLIILFFDLSSMEPDEIDRADASAEHYVDTQMAPADLYHCFFGSSLLVNQDFTSDHKLLKKQLQAFGEGSGQGFEEGTTGTTRDAK